MNKASRKKPKPEGWREVKLGEIAEIITGKTPPTKKKELYGDKYPFITPTDISEASRFCKPSRYLSEQGKNRQISSVLPENSICYTCIASIGKICITTEDSFTNQQINALKVYAETAEMLFIFYYLKYLTPKITSMAGGTINRIINKNLFSSIEISIPPLAEQEAIAEVLSSLDDKIDLLHRQNKTLEDMAQALFRQWFIEEANEEWEEVKLEHFVKCTTGHSYRSVELQPSKTALVTLKNFARDGSFRMDGYKEFKGKFKDEQIVNQGDLVVAHTDITQNADIVGNPALVVEHEQYETLIMTMDLMKVESSEEWLSGEFLFYLFKSRHFKNHCLGCANGTTVLHMSRKAIPSYRLKIPNKEKIERFTKNVKPNIEKKFANISAIKTLEKLRDILLPKLIGGKVSVGP